MANLTLTLINEPYCSTAIAQTRTLHYLQLCVSLADFIPVLPGRYKPHNTWQETLAAREEALRNRRMRAAEHWSEHTKQLPPLIVGDHVRIQNQTGPNPRKWDKTGKIIEVRQHDQYVVRIDGSGRVTLRNRKFLRKYVPVYPQRPRISIEDDMKNGTFRPYQAPESPTKSIPIEQVLQLSPAPSPTIHVPPESPMSPVNSNLRTTMAHTPPATILEPPTLDETTSTPVRSKPATCDTPLRRLSVSQIMYPSATATRGSTRKRKRPAWQSSGDYDMSTG